MRSSTPAPALPVDVPERSTVLPPEPTEAREAPLVLGFDPGSARVGWAVLMRGANGARYVAAGALDVDGAGDDALVAIRRDAGALLLRYQPAVVALERVVTVHGCARFGAAIATGLVGSAWVGGEIAGLAASRGIPVRTVTRDAARKALGCPARAGDAEVAIAVRGRIADWPTRSNEHARDAAAAAHAACQFF